MVGVSVVWASWARGSLGSVVGLESREGMVTMGVGVVGLSTTLGAFDGYSKRDCCHILFSRER